MTDQTKATRRDEVLFAFHRECATPTLDQIIDWTQRYPEFADDIRAHAGITDTVTFVGQGYKFQIWEPERFLAYREAAKNRVRDLRRRLGGRRETGDAA